MIRIINGTTRVCGVIGNPIEHTMSPMLHNFLAERAGMNMVYVPFRVEENRVADVIKGAYGLNILGLNVTVPYKKEVIASLAEIDIGAREIGAVNTLVRVEDGYKGYNTDISGLFRAMTERNISIKEQAVIMIGAGGAAKAVAYLLGREGANTVYLLNRTIEKAVELASDMNRRFAKKVFVPMALSDYQKIPKGSYLAIQTTSVGMYPGTGQAPIEDEEFYQKIHTGIDLIYRPLKTRFMNYVEAAGGITINGLSMLLYQGVTAFELWNERTVSGALVSQAYELLKEALAEYEE